ncbi:MAG: CBS domain-containing protein, partial [Candidatus Omnitrophica bacterium]|nr:CBS domain-containing protein [Candidatus Omnitrophota bacterium]
MMKKKYLGIINREVVTAAPDTTAVDIANLMVENDIGVIVVMDKGVVKGIISERDITRRIVAKNVDPKNTLASDFMTKEVLSVEISDGLNVIY